MGAKKRAPEPGGSGRTRHSMFLRRDLLERARNAAASLAGAPAFLTLADIVERALEAELGKLERKHNGGKAFGKRPVPLRGGRRAGG